MRILVTGATGFVGKHLCDFFNERGMDFSAVVRRPVNDLKNVQLVVEQISSSTNWENILNDIDVIVHLAGRAHVMHEQSTESFESYAEINIEATKNLANQAAKCGVKRFVFISSIGVNGNSSDFPLNEVLKPSPQEYYATSKKIAEDELRGIASTTNLEVVIIRPPLVYGAGVKANFKKIMKLSKLKLPLPFGSINNRRSLIYIENLIDFIMICITHPKAANETFLISDGEDVSTKKLIATLAASVNKKALLIPIPQKLLSLIFRLFGKQYLYIKVCGSLYADITKAQTLLGWKPPCTFRQGIYKTMQDECIR